MSESYLRYDIFPQGDNFFRLSIGIEDPNDLINDLNQALEEAYRL